MIVLFLSLFLQGCSVFRSNPLSQNRGAIVLVFDTRTCGSLRALRGKLSAGGACATIFAGGQIDRGMALHLHDFRDDGCEIGLSGLKGADPQSYSRSFGQQKYFQDEIVTQVLGARRSGLNPRYYLLKTLARAKSETLTLPAFLMSKGFERVVHKMPDSIPPRAKPVSELSQPLLHVYALTSGTFSREQIAALAERNEVLIVSPDLKVLPSLLEEAKARDVPFATLADLKLVK